MIFIRNAPISQPKVAYATRREPIHGGSPSGIPAVDGRYSYFWLANRSFPRASDLVSKLFSFYSQIVKAILLSLCVVVLASCGGAPTKPGDKAEQKVDESVASKGGEDLPPLELIPNPYLENKVSVSAKAKDEFARAQAAMNAKNYKAAVGLWSLMTETYPKLSGPYVNLGIANWKLGELQEAENAFKFAIQTNKYNTDAYTQLGVLYREQGKFLDAEQTYLSALEAWPHNREAMLNLGMLYDLYMGRFADALRYYRLSQRLVPEPDKTVKGWIIDLERRTDAAS